MKIDSSKSKVWESSIGNFGPNALAPIDFFNKATLDYQGNIVLIGTTINQFQEGGRANNYGLVSKLSPNGDSLWSRVYTLTEDTSVFSPNWNEFNDLVLNADGGFTMVGETTQTFNGGAGQQLWLVRVDSNGCVQEDYCSGSKPVGIEEVRLPPIEAKVYPNPASNRLNIDYVLPDGKTEGVIELYDVHGRVVKKVQVRSAIGREEVNISDWENGIYHYRFICLHCNTLSGKVVIIK